MEGKIARMSEKGFGFIKGTDGVDRFFHRSAVIGGLRFENCYEGQSVTFDHEKGDKGPRAINVAGVEA